MHILHEQRGHMLRQQRGGWVGSENWQFLLIFTINYADLGGWAKKNADVIYGWSLVPISANF
jgi:hypothetical protein